MTDPRFATVFDDLDELLSGVDVDDVGDIETLLMFLFERPVGIEAVWDDDAHAGFLEVVMTGNDKAIGSVYDFPMSIMELARSCAEAAEELGPYTKDVASPSAECPDILTMGDAELVTTLQQALGKVRLFNLMDDDQ